MLYRLGSRSSGTASGTAFWELRTASTQRPRVREIKVTLATAVASTIGLGRPAAIGVTPTSPVNLLAQEPSDNAATSSVALAWGTAPTAPTGSNYLDRLSLPGTVGAGYVWTFGPNELVIASSSALVLYNLALNGLFDIGIVLEE